MKIDDKEPDNKRDNNTTENNSEESAFDNSINTGSVGFEGDGNNGASTLRVLRKKQANNLPGTKADAKRPIL